MNNLGTVWVVISASEAQARLVDFIDNGSLAEAVGYSNTLKSLIEKMKSFVQQYGGSIPVFLYERIVMQLPSSAAEQLPAIMQDYSEALNNKVAVGIGLTMEEASKASSRSVYTGNIEMYDPETHSGSAMYKSGMKTRRWETDVVLPPNTFDPTIPDEGDYVEEVEEKHTGTPSLEHALEGQNKLIQAIAGQLGMDKMRQAQQQAQQQGEGGPRDLLEALNGGQVEGHTPEEEKAQEGQPEPSQGQPGVGQEQVQELEEEIEEAEETTADDKVAMQLDNIKGQIPQIMGLATSNPKAFKQTMDMINKLIQLAHNRAKTTKKNETREKIEDLIKAIGKRVSSMPKTGGHVFPPGTRLGKYKKVVINGKQKWRELSTGALKDDQGEAISVKEHNREAKENDRED